MTPQKQKAIELVDNFLPLLYGKKPFYKKSDLFKAKQCALICVDEIINSIEVGYEDYKSLAKINYWQEVKTEINKL